MTFHPYEVLKILMRHWRFLLLALVITLAAAAYQRLTGPTHPKKIEIPVQGASVVLRLPRSQETTEGAKILLPPSLAGAQLKWRRYPTSDAWSAIPFTAEAEVLSAALPVQPAAGKVEYHVVASDGANYPEQPVRLRYKDPVPYSILVPHVYCMFAALLFGAWVFLESLFPGRRHVPYVIPSGVLLCTTFFIIGGFILGPIVQKYAFGEYWTGFPLGDDFTDNKVLLSILFWIAACGFNFRKPHWKSAALAAVIMFAMYMIPHSFGGSQFDYEANKVRTGLQKR